MKLFRPGEAGRILLVAAMMAALALSAGELAARLVPGFDPTLLALLAFLVALEGTATDRLARQFPEAGLRLRLHLVEWVVIVAALRLVLSLSQGSAALAADLGLWLAQPLRLFDAGLAAAAALLAMTWWLGVQMARCLEALGPQPESPPPADSAAYYAWLTRPQEDSRGECWERLRRLVLAGGLLLLVCSGLARQDLALALSLRHPAIAGIVGNALLYCALGLALLSQGHYAMLRARWQRQDVPVARPLGRRWAVLAVAFTALVAAAVLLLPARPSLAVFGAAWAALQALFFWATQLAALALMALGYLLNLILSLFGVKPAPEGARSEPLAVPTPQPQPEVAPADWWQAIQGLVLWAAIAAVLIYALAHFVRERRELWRLLAARGGPLGWLGATLVALWRWLAGAGHAAGRRWRTLVARRPSAARPEARRGPRWPRPRTVRERMRLLYLLSLRETARLGRPRRAADTPYEYAQRVAPELAEGREELQGLTQAFVEARYSRHDPPPAQVGPLTAAYRRLRRACRRMLGRSGT
ncbi:MAG TPA: DUF4129 domain-containing protein [Anaerolineae bacterium]|nr:DUF4129 domain-containing protein [Anaerolineae bacterium]HOQ99648.1 DUF4129 domain-containing protein [Anaerolineae bacterium]HPL26767.1 DUF4129 domain-containing protein [Anaerolineae bacterium]